MSQKTPKSHRRRWLLVASTFLLLGLVGAGLLRVPAVQRWLVTRALNQQTGLRVAIERLNAGLGGVESRGIDFAMPGINMRSSVINVRVLPSRLLHGELHLEQIEVKQLRIELAPAPTKPSPTPQPSAPFAGILALLRAPIPWIIQDTNVDAEFVVMDSGREIVVSRLSLRGGGVSAGKSGTFTYDFSVSSASLPAGADSRAVSRGTLRIAQNTTYGVEEIELDGDFTLPAYGSLSLPPGHFRLNVAAAPEGERYSALLRFDRGGKLEWQGQLDSNKTRLTGTLGFHVDSALAAEMGGIQLPAAQIDGKLVGAVDLKTGALEATIATELAAREWQRVMPQLAAVDALSGKFDAALSFRDGQTEIRTATLALRGAATPFELRAALDTPLSLAAAAPVARGHLALAHLPFKWANPFVGSAVQFTTGEFSGEWSLAVEADQTVRFTTTRPMEAGPVMLAGKDLPPLPGLSLHFSPRFEVSPVRIAFGCDDLVVSSTEGDRVTLALSAAHDVKAKETRLTGKLGGALPSLFASPDRTLPFTLGASWDATQTAAALRVATLEFTAQSPNHPEPVVSLALREPVEFGVDDGLQRQRDVDLLTFKVRDLPLAWTSRWLKNYELSGVWSGGDSALRRAPTGRGFVFLTREPWRLSNLGIAVGGQTLFSGHAQCAPAFELGERRSTVRLRELELADRSGNRITGETNLDWIEAENKFSVELALDAALAALPGTADTIGPLTAMLRTRAHSVAATESQVTQFRFELRRSASPLVTISAAEPFRFTSQPNGELLFSSAAPLTVDLARIPLVWLQPLLPDQTKVDGMLEPMTLELHATPRNFRLRAAQPVSVANFSYARHGVPKAQGANGTFSPGAELTFSHQLRPVFQIAYSGHLRADAGALDVSGARAIDFSGTLGFRGDDKHVALKRVDAVARVNFAALHRVPILAANGMPSAGKFAFDFHGDFQGEEPPAFTARLEGVPAAGGGRILPPLELDGRGQLSPDGRAINFAVATRFATAPRPSDAAFQIDVVLGQRTQTFSSALRSSFFDVGEVMALADAFAPPGARRTTPPPAATPEAPSAPSTAFEQPSPRLGVPFWGELRGHFDLELGAVQLAPYRIEGVRGRLELTDRALALTNFAGEMFSGRWDGALRVDYDPAATKGDHALSSHFRINQIETARAIAAALPNEFGSLDTRLDVDVALGSAGNRWWELLDRAQGEFTVQAKNGVARLTHPQLGTASVVLALAGTLSFSSEMRALGRLLGQFAQLPVQQLVVRGAREDNGEIVLREFRLESPQARILGQGRVPAVAGVPLAARKLDLAVELAAKDDMAVLLGKMKLLEKSPQPDGFRRMTEPFALGGEVGNPDPSKLYELLARAVAGSSGTWAFIMRKVQNEIEKQPPIPAK